MGKTGPTQLSAWFDGHAAALALYARQWLEAGLAEDVVQDVFLRLARQRRQPDNAKAWLFRCVRNAAINVLRSQRRRRRHEQRRAAERASWFVSRGDELIDAEAAQAALAELPAEQREVIVLRIWAGLTLREAGEVVGQPVSTVFSRYRAGLAGLRERMRTSCKSEKT